MKDGQLGQLVEAVRVAPKGRLGLSELLVNWSRKELFLRGYSFSSEGADTPSFAWKSGADVVAPCAERLARPDLQKAFPECPTALCGFILIAPLPRKFQLPLKGSLYVGAPSSPLRSLDIDLTKQTASFNADIALDDVFLVWPWSELLATGALIGDGAPVLRSVLCDGAELDVRDAVLSRPKKGDGPTKRRPLDLNIPLRRVVGKTAFQILPSVDPVIEFIFAKADSSYGFSASISKKGRIAELGVGHINAVHYSTENQHLRVKGGFFAHFDVGRVELTINGDKQGEAASVVPIDIGSAPDLERACDAPFSGWSWCDRVRIDPAAPLIIEARLQRGSRIVAHAAARFGAGGVCLVNEPLIPSYYTSPLRPVFEELIAAAGSIDAKAPIMAFVFPGDMSRTFGGGPSRVISMASYFRRMGFQTILLDRLAEGVATTICDAPLREHFDMRLGIGRNDLTELARMAFDAASRSETEQAIRNKLSAALEPAVNGEAADLIRRREDPNFDLVAAYLLYRIKPDVVIANFAWTAGLLRMLPASVCKVLDTHDIQHIRGEIHAAASGDEALRADKMVEIGAWNAADYVIAIQAEEKDTIIEVSGRNNVVLAGHAAQTLAAAREAEPAPIVLFVGNRYLPNTEGLRRFLQQSWPQVRQRVPDAALLVVGTVGQDFSSAPEGVHILGVVPNLEEIYKRAAVVVSPLEIGTGLSIKVVEALCAGRAVVSTATGMRGFASRGMAIEGMAIQGMAIQVEFDELADAVARILENPQERRRLEAAALAFAASELTPERVYRELFNTIELKLYQ